MDLKDLLRHHKRAVYGLLALAGFLYLEGQIFGFVGDLDVCASDRFTIQSEQTTLWQNHRSLSSFVFRAAVWSMLVFLVLLVTWGEDKAHTSQFYVPQFQWNWNTFFGTAFVLLWYGSTYALITLLKVVMGDTTCGGAKSNSVSGHFSFFYFYGVGLPYLALILLPHDNARLSLHDALNPKSTFHFKLLLLSLSYAVFLFGGLFTLSQTWSWGYHSLRQILYGIVLGLGSHLALRAVLKKASSSTPAPPPTLPHRLPADMGEFQTLVNEFFPVSYLALFNVVSLVLVLLVTFGFPFNSYEVLGFVVLWPALIYSFLYLRGRFHSHSTLDQ